LCKYWMNQANRASLSPMRHTRPRSPIWYCGNRMDGPTSYYTALPAVTCACCMPIVITHIPCFQEMLHVKL